MDICAVQTKRVRPVLSTIWNKASRHEEITGSITYARRIQEAMMLKEKHLKRIFPESFIYYKPKDIVSGDFYWFAKHEHKVIVAAADCTGHGIPGAFMSVLGISLLNQVIMEDRLQDPAQILQKLNHKIVKAFHTDDDGTQGSNDGMDIALCSIDYHERKIIFSGAFRPAYVINQNGLMELKGSRHPIGGLQHQPTIFANNTISFQPGDAIYLFTDGYADQFGGPRDKKMLVKNFRQLIYDTGRYSSERQKQELDHAFSNWKGNNEQTDDILVMGMRL